MSDLLNNKRPLLTLGDVLPELEVIRLGMDMCTELDICNRDSKLHGEITAENIFVCENGIYTLGTGERPFDSIADIRALGEVMCRMLNVGENGASAELLAVLDKSVYAGEDGSYTEITEMKKDLMTLYASAYFDGVSVSVSGEMIVGEGNEASIRRDVREMKRGTQNADLTDTIIADSVPTDNEVEYRDPFGELSGREDDAYRSAIEAGASVTQAAKIMNASSKKWKKKPSYNTRSKVIWTVILLIVAVLILAVLISIPIITYMQRDKDDVESPGDSVVHLIRGIEISMLPDKLSYAIGEIIDTNGLELTVKYESGESERISGGYTVSPSRIEASGEQDITVSYKGFTACYSIRAYSTEIDSIIIISLPEKTEYELGEEIDFTGLLVDVVYSDGERDSRQSGFVCSPTVAETEGEQKITVSYEGKQAEFLVNVTKPEAVLGRVVLRTKPSKTAYEIGEKVSMGGFSLTAHYSDGTKKIVTTGYTYTPTSFDKVGNHKITVTYQGKIVEVNVTVTEPLVPPVSMVGIVLKSLPGKLTYMIGESLDTSGLSVYAKYSDGSEKALEGGFVCSPTRFESAGDTDVTVKLDEFVTTFRVSVNSPIRASGVCGKNTEWTLENSVLTVSGSGQMDDFTKNGAPWAQFAAQIDKIIVEDSVLGVGEYAFANTDAKTVIIGKSVRTIGLTAFTGCGKLTAISVSDSNRFFSDYKGVLLSKDGTVMLAYPIGKSDTSFTVPSGVTSIGGYRIFEGSRLREITICQTLSGIDPTAFVGAENLERFRPGPGASVLEVHDGVLYTKRLNALVAYPSGRKGDSFSLPEGVGVIRENAFCGADITEITLPISLYRVDDGAFGGATKLALVKYVGSESDFAKIVVNSNNDSFTAAKYIFNTAE